MNKYRVEAVIVGYDNMGLEAYCTGCKKENRYERLELPSPDILPPESIEFAILQGIINQHEREKHNGN